MSVVSMGELLIDFVSLESGVTVGEASGFQKAPGGAPANVAVGVARLGQKSAFLGQVGDDPFGYFLRDVLANEGINLRGLRFTDRARTMLAFVSLGEGGERSFQFYRHPSADMLMSPEDVAFEVIDVAQVFHFGSITTISEPSASATYAAANRAIEQGLTVSYDPNLRLALWSDADAARAGLKKGLDYAHVVKISEDEVDFLVGGDIAKLWRDQTKLIVVTYGAGGSEAYVDGGTSPVAKHDGHTVEPVDTTGAGDGFVAGLLTQLVERGEAWRDHLPEILCFANAVGALATTQRGAIPALPSRATVDAMTADC